VGCVVWKRGTTRKGTLQKLVIAVFAEIPHACVGNEDESVIVRFDCCADVKEPDPIGANGEPIPTDRAQDAPNLWTSEFAACNIKVDPYPFGSRTNDLRGILQSGTIGADMIPGCRQTSLFFTGLWISQLTESA
jgi:hypothetical protein